MPNIPYLYLINRGINIYEIKKCVCLNLKIWLYIPLDFSSDAQHEVETKQRFPSQALKVEALQFIKCLDPVE